MKRLLCKLPRWLGGGHRWRRLTVKERMARSDFKIPQSPQYRKCFRCGAERIVKARKKTKEATNE